MSEQKFKKGDRVKVTIEGDVRDVVDQEVCLWGWVYYLSTASPGVVAIEKLVNPLPTTPGSVIRTKRSRYTRLLHDDGTWHGRYSGERGVRGEDLGDPTEWEILHDAGAVK